MGSLRYSGRFTPLDLRASVVPFASEDGPIAPARNEALETFGFVHSLPRIELNPSTSLHILTAHT